MDNKIISRSAFALIITLHLVSPLLCQEENQAFRESVEEILALTDETDQATLLEELAELKDSPVNINRGDNKEISRLFFLTEFQVLVLADHVRKNGDVVTLYELALLPAFDRNTVMLMAPYVSLEPMAESGAKGYGRTTVTLTASTRFSSGESESAGIRSLLRMTHDQGRFSIGLTAENDPDEQFTFRNAPGVDFLSGYIEFQGNGFIDRVIAGDFALKIGEGMVFNSNRWMGSWLSSPSFMSGRSSAMPYRSAEENNFFRGISIIMGNINTGAVLFASSNMIDARPIYNADSTAAGVSNLVSGGLHVSESQLVTRNSLTESVAGIHVTMGAEKIRGGVTSSVTWFSLPFRPDNASPENIHAFEGNRVLNFAIDFKAGTGPVLFFSEAALSMPGSWAATAGLRAKPAGTITFNLLARHFSPDYHSFHSGAFRAGSGPGNETGIAASVHLEIVRHLFVTAAADHYRIPWPRYRSSSPSYGSRMELKGEYQPQDNLSLRLSYTASSREYDSATWTGTAVSVTHTRRQLSFAFACNPAAGFHLTTRATAAFVAPSEEKGYLLCQDFSFTFRNVPLRLWFRYALCSSGGWDSRLYAWENDLLSSFSVPAFYGEMTRSFIMLSWKPADRVETRLKYALTDSANEMKHELKGQLRISF